MNYRKELIQVAAVAAAMIEDNDFGEANYFAEGGFSDNGWTPPARGEVAMRAIGRERIRQDEKWGPQHHDRFTWLMILMEEVGELAEELQVPPDTVVEDAEEAYLNFLVNRIVEIGNRAKAWLEAKALA